MARSGSMTYDPTTGKWSSSGGGGSSNRRPSSGGGNKQPSSGSGNTKPSSSSGGNMTSSNSNPHSSTGSAEKKYNTIEYNILTGQLKFIATKETIKLTAGDTVKLNGLGKYLSGLYFVQDVTRQISKEGYSHSATVIKTDFGNSLKKTSTSTVDKKVPKKKKPEKKKGTQPAKKPKKTSQRIHYLKAGECLWSVARKYYGNGAQYPKIAKANNISPSQYRRLPIGLKLIIP